MTAQPRPKDDHALVKVDELGCPEVGGCHKRGRLKPDGQCCYCGCGPESRRILARGVMLPCNPGLQPHNRITAPTIQAAFDQMEAELQRLAALRAANPHVDPRRFVRRDHLNRPSMTDIFGDR